MENQTLIKWCYNQTGGAILSKALHSPVRGEKRRSFAGVMSNHYATLKWYFVGKAISISHSANYHAAVQNILLFSSPGSELWLHLKLSIMQAGLALSAANRHQIYGTLNLTEQSFPVNGRRVEKLLLCERPAPSARYIAVSHSPLFSPSKLIRFSSGAMTASINDSRAQIKGI